jgi:hypothetical protein
VFRKDFPKLHRADRLSIIAASRRTGDHRGLLTGNLARAERHPITSLRLDVITMFAGVTIPHPASRNPSAARLRLAGRPKRRKNSLRFAFNISSSSGGLKAHAAQ